MFPAEKGKVFFAPMEGITDDAYRQVIQNLYPEWDYLACDFLRVPTVGEYSKKHIIKHYGHQTYASDLKQKTLYQILTSPTAQTEQTVQQINELDIPWLDLNLGCPSKTVVKNHGGSYLLSCPNELRSIIRTIRSHFQRTFTVKIRIGFQDDSLFESNLKLLEDEGVDAITIHGRTREQQYKGRANWAYIKRATEILKIPVIANGDIWSIEDIDECFQETNCHSVMIARGALKTPWLAWLYREKITLSKKEKIEKIKEYFLSLHQAFSLEKRKDNKIHRSFKGLSRYLFDDFNDGEEIKRKILRGQSLSQFFELIDNF